MLAVLVTTLIGSLQFLYFRYVGDEWLIYSYEDQGFQWDTPHFHGVLLSWRCGWLVYTPMMGFAVLGLITLFNSQRAIFPAVFLFLLVNLYIASAWSVWWYGGSLGSRSLVQSYAVWLFPFASMIQWVQQQKWRKLFFWPIALICIYLNLWWTHQAHRGHGAFVAEQMTKGFFLKVVGRNTFNQEWVKLLDTKDYFDGAERKHVRTLLREGFETDTSVCARAELPLEGQKSYFLDKDHQFTPEYRVPASPANLKGWVRASCVFAAEPKEWEWWIMTQFIVRFTHEGKIIKESMIRLHRHIEGGETKEIYFDTKVPNQPFDQVAVLFWNGNGQKRIKLDAVHLEAFE